MRRSLGCCGRGGRRRPPGTEGRAMETSSNGSRPTSSTSTPPPPSDDGQAILQSSRRQPAPAPRNTLAQCLDPADELEVLIRARYPVIYVVSWEEERVEKELARISASRNKKFYVWTCTQGIVRYGAEPQRAKSTSGNTTDPLSALDAVLQHVEPAIYLFKDFHPFTEENRCNIAVIRRLKDVAFQLRDSYKTIVIVAPLMRIAPELD